MIFSYKRKEVNVHPSVVRRSRDICLSDTMSGLVGCYVAAAMEVLIFVSFLLVIAWCDISS